MQKNNGFTLIELIVTLSVLAIIASVAVPSFSDHIIKQSLDNSGREILSALSEGRNRAVAMRSIVIVCPSKDSAAKKITLTQCVTNTITGADSEKFISQNRVVIAEISDRTNVTSTVSGVVFLPMGNAQSAKTFTLCANKKLKTISVAATGASEISTGTC